tara:strand:+ start:3906 stop:4337 length:432 start_codon:yes stop_codon:yes gene_type:complete
MVEYDFGVTEGILREGDWPFVISHAEERTSKAGNPMIVARCDAVTDKEFEPITHYFVFSPRAEKMLRRDLRTLGFKVPPDGSPFKFEGAPLDFVNKQFVGHVKHEEFDGKTQAKIAWMNKAPENASASTPKGFGGGESVEIPF